MRLLTLVLLIACGPAQDSPTGPTLDPDLHGYAGTLAFVDANVLSMATPEISVGQTVLVRAGRVVEVRPTADGAPPADARVIDLQGAYLMPGLADMHIHLRREHVQGLLRSGVTTVRDLWGHSETLELRAESRLDGLVPRVVLTGPGIDGSPPIRPTPAVLDRAGDAVGLVSDLLAQEWEALKVYQNLRHAPFIALADAAEAAGIGLVGHVPTDVPLEVALGRMRSIEHLEGYDKALAGQRLTAFRSWPAVDRSLMPIWAERTAESGTWNTPTMVIVRRALSNNASGSQAVQAMENVRLMVRHLHEAGAQLLAGTDAGIAGILPGASLHDELSEFVRAGLTPFEAIRTATVNPARFLGMEGESGVVEAGAWADLLVVGSNPLENLDAARAPTAVVLRGRLLLTDSIT